MRSRCACNDYSKNIQGNAYMFIEIQSQSKYGGGKQRIVRIKMTSFGNMIGKNKPTDKNRFCRIL